MAFEKIEKYDEKTTAEISARVREILALLGEDPEREGLLKTPERVAKSLQFLTQGYGQNGQQIIQSAIFEEKYQQMVLVKDIELYSMCEHHMLPFIGKCHVAYIPNGKITGLSKIARGPGEAYCPDQGLHRGCPAATRSSSSNRSHAHLHVPSRSAEIKRHHYHFCLLWNIPEFCKDEK